MIENRGRGPITRVPATASTCASGTFILYVWHADNKVEWFINGEQVRPLVFRLPDEAMMVSLGLWKPGEDWEEAYDPFLDSKGAPDLAQNGHIENDRFRSKCLDQEWCSSLQQSRVLIEAWRISYSGESATIAKDHMPAGLSAAQCLDRNYYQNSFM